MRSLTLLSLCPLVALTLACGPEADDFDDLESGAVAAPAPPPSTAPSGTRPAATTTLPTPPTDGLVLVDVWLTDRRTYTIMHATRLADRFEWPLPYYDVPPSWVFFVYQPTGDADAAAIMGSRFVVDFTVGTSVLTRGPDGTSASTDYYVGLQTALIPSSCSAGKPCLVVAVRGSRLYAMGAPWSTVLRYAPRLAVSTVGGSASPVWRSSAWTIAANPWRVPYFSAEIFPAFQSERCQSCHRLGDQSTLVAQHHGLISLGDSYVETTEHGSRVKCGFTCHTNINTSVPGATFHDTEWFTPGFDQGIDWSTFRSARAVCLQVRSRLHSSAELSGHFFGDARIGWAVHSGVLPFGIPRETAPPHDFDVWQGTVGWWIMAGAPCP